MQLKERLKAELKPHKRHYDAETKMRILLMVENGVQLKLVARTFGVTIQTVINWRKEYVEHGSAGLEDRHKSGRPPALSKEQIESCVNAIWDRKEVPTSRVIQKEIRDIYGRNFTLQGIRKMLARADITRKKLQPVHARAATNETADKWCSENFPVILYALGVKYVLLSVDECRIERDDAGRYGYAKRGKRLYGKYVGKHQGVTVTGGVSNDGRSIFRTSHKANTDSFLTFLKAAHRKFDKVVVTADNASYHRSKAVKEWIKEHPEVILICIPTGSPHMSAVENAWPIIKSRMRDTIYETREDFVKAVSKNLRIVRFDFDVLGKLNSRLPEEALRTLSS